ncbi:MAG: sodium ion-translocating decarboxylase subunit beta, partial [Desulfobacterota bacterium]|nr:sodium ion-translocating decarboxylase subunit beta [Thermodesulfobacteriota bacterium]
MLEHFSLLHQIILKTGFVYITPGHIIMWGIAFLFIYLAIKKGFEPLLLLPIGFGILIVNIPLAPIMG